MSAGQEFDFGIDLPFIAFKGEVDLPEDSVQAIAQTPDGYLWLGTRGGLVRFDGLQFVECSIQSCGS